MKAWQSLLGTGRSVASQIYCPAWRGPGGRVSRPAGQHIQSQCTRSEGRTDTSLLHQVDMK